MPADRYNINEFTALYHRTIRGAGSTGTVVTLELPRVKPGWLIVLTHVTVEDKTTAYTKVRLLINHQGINHYLDELDSPAAAELAVSRSDILLGEQDIFAAELTGTTDSDELVMTAIGWTKQL